MPKVIKKNTTLIKKPVVVTQPQFKLVTFKAKNLLMSPRKLRLLANEVKKHSPLESLVKLKLSPTKAARILTRCVANVISDAKNNFHLDPESLSFKTFLVNEGQKIKRMDKSHGSRFNRGIIFKRRSLVNITVVGQPGGPKN